jgi:prepilin-type N-terminal cleavage/methylation domain-containing protein
VVLTASPTSGEVHLPFDEPRGATHYRDTVRSAGIPASGFSLVEVAIVMVILVILSAIAIPRFATAAQNSTADLVARRLAADLRIAQAQAIQTQQQQSVVIAADGYSYTIVGMAHPDHPAKPFVVLLDHVPYRGAWISAVNLGGTRILTFDRFGGPSASGTITVTAASRSRNVRISAGAGRITVE